MGLGFETLPAQVLEERAEEESPRAYVERLAREKALAVSTLRPECLVLGGDTVVVAQGEVIEKPESPAHAVAMLESLSGLEHHVFTGMALVAPGGRVYSTTRAATVTFRQLGQTEIEAYVETREPLDKAGGYGIQGFGAALVSAVTGDYYAVVGLSVHALVALLGQAGIRYSFGALHPDGSPTT